MSRINLICRFNEYFMRLCLAIEQEISIIDDRQERPKEVNYGRQYAAGCNAVRKDRSLSS